MFAPDGTQVYPTLMDANGNFLSGVDTLNRTPVTASSGGDDIWRGTPAATFTYDVLDSRGSTQRYTVIFQTISVNTNFLQPNTTEYSGTLTVVQEIDLPDGTKYQFTYDSGTTPGHFGTMTSMNNQRHMVLYSSSRPRLRPDLSELPAQGHAHHTRQRRHCLYVHFL